MLIEMERIVRTYPVHSSVDSVFLLEDYFLEFEILNRGYDNIDG